MTLLDGVHPVRPDEDDVLLHVWEASVRATHHFLTESDVQLLKPHIVPGLRALPHLLCVRAAEGAMVAFLGVDGSRLEALFVHPSWHRAGIGRRLTRHAIADLGVTSVDVNEQNPGAVAFYRRLGFEVDGRSECDSLGLPFPLLHMRLGRSGLR